jgi:hypothetical protein
MAYQGLSYAMSEAALRHTEHLAKTVGPRGSTTAKEREGHDYCQATLEGLGYAVERETFFSPTSGWRPHALALALMLVWVAIFVLLGGETNRQALALAAAAFGLVTVVSFFLGLVHRPNPLTWLLPVDRSQNVWAVAQPRGEVKQKVVVTGHVDTHRTALAMQSPGLWQVFKVLTTLAGIAMVALVGVFVWGIFTPDSLPRTVALYLAIVPALGLIFTAQPDLTPFVAGANDNATGAAAVLALAERLKTEPLANTAVFLVNTGCEEVGCWGVKDWITRHAKKEAAGASYLVLDNIGGRGSEVNYVLDETILIPVRSDPALVALAERVARENPALGAKPWHYRGLDSELSACTVFGQKALGLLNFDPKTGMPPNFHTVRDDMGNIDPAVLDRSEQFAWAMMRAIDGSEGSEGSGELGEMGEAGDSGDSGVEGREAQAGKENGGSEASEGQGKGAEAGLGE